ncbi:hypothetical protein PPERSA_10876 [Pseudocohnilembus persalinus]|uniref:Uncharacterized protein n=1 Tax=Pseudocohnilembus persalinus TaxID=266149 RepID=A0A0V0R6V8_PSEPJ|nr:hypothetical protein PPERSA_10876 [Pseudocohnilembus persalinus]|eukprot:KRX10210.1 hypothetical protein PPERSA_10876 [Pseudocohnilembus persalinus]
MNFAFQKGNKGQNLENLTFFKDGRIHAKFLDKSSLIVHKGSKCATYFKINGEKRRFLMDTVPGIENCRQKLENTLRAANCLNDVPILTLENLYPEYLLEYNQKKLNSCIWNCDISNPDFFEINKQSKEISLYSIDGHAKIILQKERFTFLVEYKQLIPVKKPKLMSKKEDKLLNDNELQEKENEKYGNCNQGYNFSKQFMKKYNIPEVKRKKEAEEKGETVKIHFSYIKIQKIYSVFKFPSRWSVPLFLVWQIYLENFSGSEKLLKEPVFKPQLKMFIYGINSQQQQMQRNLEKQHNSIFGGQNSEFSEFSHQQSYISEIEESRIENRDDNEILDEIQQIGQKYFQAFKIANSNEIITELPSIGVSQFISNNNIENINTKNMWNFDNAAPSFEHPKYEKQVAFTWNNNIIGWYCSLSQEIISYNQNKGTFIYSTSKGMFMHYLEKNVINQNQNQSQNQSLNQIQSQNQSLYQEENQENRKKLELDQDLGNLSNQEKVFYDVQKMNKDDILSGFRDFFQSLVSIKYVRDFNDNLKKICSFNNEFRNKNRDITNDDDNDEQDEENYDINDKNKEQENIEQNIVYLSDKFDVIQKIENEEGIFEAYKNGFVKAKFMDRTICKLSKNQNYIDIITKFGDEYQVYLDYPKEFEYYVGKVLEFQEFVFMDPKKRYEKMLKEEQFRASILHELEKNDRFLCILQNQAPESSKEQMSQSDIYSEFMRKQQQQIQQCLDQSSFNCDLEYNSEIQLQNQQRFNQSLNGFQYRDTEQRNERNEYNFNNYNNDRSLVSQTVQSEYIDQSQNYGSQMGGYDIQEILRKNEEMMNQMSLMLKQ